MSYEDSKLFVAQHKDTKLYLKNAGHYFVFANRNWIAHANPSIEEVREQIELRRQYLIDNGVAIWTDVVNDSEIWNDYDVETYLKYFPEVGMVEVYLTTTSMQ